MQTPLYIVLIDKYQTELFWVSSGEYASERAAQAAQTWNGVPSSFARSRWSGSLVAEKPEGLRNEITGAQERPAAIYQLRLQSSRHDRDDSSR